MLLIVLVVMVSDNNGMLSFFVRRILAQTAFCAERRARCSGASGTSRLIVLFGAADWMVYVSKMVSCIL